MDEDVPDSKEEIHGSHIPSGHTQLWITQCSGMSVVAWITLSDFRMPRFVDESRKNRLLDPADLGAVAPA
jgi:hypothetical protein